MVYTSFIQELILQTNIELKIKARQAKSIVDIGDSKGNNEQTKNKIYFKKT